MAIAPSAKPLDGLDDGEEARTWQLLSNSKSQVAHLAEEVKRLRVENTRVITTLMREEKGARSRS